MDESTLTHTRLSYTHFFQCMHTHTTSCPAYIRMQQAMQHTYAYNKLSCIHTHTTSCAAHIRIQHAIQHAYAYNLFNIACIRMQQAIQHAYAAHRARAYSADETSAYSLLLLAYCCVLLAIAAWCLCIFTCCIVTILFVYIPESLMLLLIKYPTRYDDICDNKNIHWGGY